MFKTYVAPKCFLCHSNSVSQRCPIDVFRYLDYRTFLETFYRTKKPHGYSYRKFSQRAHLRSPNYLKLVIEGKRNLTAAMASRFADACGLHGDAKEYFEKLVEFNQARSTEDRNRAYHQLTSFSRYRRAQKLEVAHGQYHSKWYLPAIRELAARTDFKNDPNWIAPRLLPPITSREAAQALELLLRLGLLQRDDTGRLFQGSPVLTTGPETKGLHIVSYHKSMMIKAAESIDIVAPSERDISSLTMCLGPGGLNKLKEQIQAFRNELIKLAETEPDPRQVVQLNIQLFPLSKRDDDQGESK
ncbi:MAG: TIGR02147 family protein [Deltaproteobacteria bacterium]|nr:TIGR02147 family protein [Deltaproteobacteria bacterium]